MSTGPLSRRPAPIRHFWQFPQVSIHFLFNPLDRNLFFSALVFKRCLWVHGDPGTAATAAAVYDGPVSARARHQHNNTSMHANRHTALQLSRWSLNNRTPFCQTSLAVTPADSSLSLSSFFFFGRLSSACRDTASIKTLCTEWKP